MAKILRPAKGVNCDAVLSPCEIYRYVLRREWDNTRKSLMVVGLNPSTADATTDDPTIAKMTRLARSWGYGSLIMTNLWAFRATEPSSLLKLIKSHGEGRGVDPIGPDNDLHLEEEAGRAGAVLAAWGVNGGVNARDHDVRQLLERKAVLHVLKLSQGGFPCHPLYLKENLVMVPWGQYKKWTTF